MQPTKGVTVAAGNFGCPSPHARMALNDMSDTTGDTTGEFEYLSLKRARRLLRICDIAVTKQGDDRRIYLERACCDDPELLAEAVRLLDAVDDSQNFLMDFEQFRSLPPRKV
ncbi:MAG: hypothetical protein AAF004_13230 [Pseudomonadota bacterium]